MRCTGKARPDVVLFGENLDETLVHGVFNQIPSVDLVLVVGTSAQVFPAADIIPRALRHRAKVVVVDPNVPDELKQVGTIIPTGAEVALPLMLDFVSSVKG